MSTVCQANPSDGNTSPRFVKLPDLVLGEVTRAARAEYESFDEPLLWVRAQIDRYFDVAQAGITAKYGQ